MAIITSVRNGNLKTIWVFLEVVYKLKEMVEAEQTGKAATVCTRGYHSLRKPINAFSVGGGKEYK